jgi:competence CoiA-like predicted nuclease
MLSCIVGKNKVNAFGNKKDKLKKYSQKGLLKCPVCSEELIYRHGEIRIPHFAHKISSDCNFGQGEPETEEHSLGKKYLYKWLKKQFLIADVELEYWMPEIKQRPDLWFKDVNGQEYCIEFQCSPTTLGHIRDKNQLYELNNVTSIWIFGTQRIPNKTVIFEHLGYKYRFSHSTLVFKKGNYKQSFRKRDNFYFEDGKFFVEKEIQNEFQNLIEPYNNKVNLEKLRKQQEIQYIAVQDLIKIDKKINKQSNFEGKFRSGAYSEIVHRMFDSRYMNEWDAKMTGKRYNIITDTNTLANLRLQNQKVIDYPLTGQWSCVVMAYLIDKQFAWEDEVINFNFTKNKSLRHSSSFRDNLLDFFIRNFGKNITLNKEV